MREVTLFIAMSLDGYIADANGKVDWLEGQGDGISTIDTFAAFAEEIDTVIMGWNTYHQIVTELSPEEWVYRDFTTYVITHKDASSAKVFSAEKIHFTATDPAALLQQLKTETGKGIWICGGANIAQQCIKANLIDRYYITMIPTLLGSGIRLFGAGKTEKKLRLLQTQSYDGMVDLVYTRR